MSSSAADDTGRAPTAGRAAGPTVRVLGVRHHGPGSARAVVAALDRLDPQVVLIEGPADADPIVPWAAVDMQPPVALLGYAADEPGRAAYWPFAVFSPEWQAIQWALGHRVPVRFIDLPAATVLAQRAELATAATPADENADDADDGAGGTDDTDDVDAEPDAADPRLAEARRDPIAVLARAAGYDDPERWWDDVVEHRQPEGADPFDLIAEAMAQLRPRGDDAAGATDPECDLREAHMRQVLRAVLKEGHQRVAVVCGAWHAPALQLPLPPASRDAAALRGIPKRKTTLTWIPWTHGRLAYTSGYGAGVVSPGWYAHLFATPQRTVADWLTRVAGVLRAEDLPVSSAHVIEAVRLAQTLATLRGRPLAGLAEVTEATRAVICEGNEVTLDLVTRRLVVGEALGAVPEGIPTVPLESDLAALTRRLRLKRDPVPAVKDLDLRNATDLERSRLLHRLRLLGVPWGTTTAGQTRSTGTFRETWELAWAPEYAVDVVEASAWGTTVETAAVARVCSDALGANLPELTGLLERALLADIGEAMSDLLAALDARAARDHDIGQLMGALPALVRSLRYGDVRGTDLSSLARVAEGLHLRICAGLPAAVGSLDDDGAAQLRRQIDAVHEALALLADQAARERWLDTLGSLIGRADVHGLLAGRMTRLLLDAGRLATEAAGDRLARALSVGSEPSDKAAWVEGFLSGSGLLLIHDTALLALLDDWVRTLDADAFLDVAPLLRRTFGQLAAGERRSIGEAVRHLTSGPARATGAGTGHGGPASWDAARSAAAVETVAALLGLRPLPARLTSGPGEVAS